MFFLGFLARPLSPASISPQSEQQKTVTEYQEKKRRGKKRMYCNSKLQIKTREEMCASFLVSITEKVTHQEPAAEVILAEVFFFFFWSGTDIFQQIFAVLFVTM